MRLRAGIAALGEFREALERALRRIGFGGRVPFFPVFASLRRRAARLRQIGLRSLFFNFRLSLRWHFNYNGWRCIPLAQYLVRNEPKKQPRNDCGNNAEYDLSSWLFIPIALATWAILMFCFP